MPTTTQWRYFLSVAKHSNLTKASEELYITQQALSRSISTMEAELGCTLFERSERGTVLTLAGKKIYPVVSMMIEKYDSYISIISSLLAEKRVTLSLLFEHPFMEYMISPELIGRMGDIMIRTGIAQSYPHCYQAVLSGEYDLAMVHKPQSAGALQYIPLYSEPPVIIMNEKNPLSQKQELHISDLRHESQVLPNVNATIVREYLAACIDEGFYPNYVFETSSLEMTRRYVRDNNAIVLAAGSGLNGYGDMIVTRPLIHPTLMLEVGFLVRNDYENNPSVASFIRAAINLIARE